ncbi:MAG TPA: DUF58 domain-containing protein [Mycobacteriales bacterium]|jgi:uncharacterized protein (DUF58 family)|nr:DUF58 domain-containing protein [Mycobacteriales bacterium]
MTAVRLVLRSLTLRGRCAVAAGITASITGLSLGEVDLLRLGLLLLALPLVAGAFVVRTRFRLSCTRRLEPARIAAGSRSRAVLRIENVSRIPTGLLLIEDTIPYLLGGRPRVVVERLAPRRPIDVGYHLIGEARGRYRVGPLTVRLLDPFGLCELPRAFTSVDTLVVTPRVETLPETSLRGEWGGAGQSTSRVVSTHGDDDVATREYRHGDDLRRIHWRTTARRGELTVRREEQPWESRAAVLLDSRLVAHRGDGPASSLEWAVSAAASVSLHLAQRGFDVRLVTDTGGEVSSSNLGGLGFDGALLDVLASLSPSTGQSLHVGVDATRRAGGHGLIVAVVGALRADDAERLARLRATDRSTGVVLMLDTDTWTAAPVTAAAERAQVIGLLTTAGWRVVEVRRGDSVAQVWASLGATATVGAVS